MKHRPQCARPARSVSKAQSGKGCSLRDRHADAERCKLAAAASAAAAESPAESECCNGDKGDGQSPGLAAVLAADQTCVMILDPAQKLTFTGKCIMTCLYGSVQVFGFTINQSQATYKLYSPHTHSALTIEGLMHKIPSKPRKEIRMEARALLRRYLPLDSRRTLMKSFRPSSSILLLERLEDAVTNFILSHTDYSNIFTPKAKEKSSLLDNAVLCSVGIENRDPESGHIMSDKSILAVEQLIDACLEEQHGCPIILVCGPRNVGKSTFNRYLINQLLNHISCVGYLECDLGQTEFTPPGCVSLLSITKPVIGPPYTHQREAHRMVYFGETSCEQDMERFVESVKYVITSYKRKEPLIINTMGWVKGFGLMLLIDLIRLLSPSHIVQIGAKGVEDMKPLTVEYIQDSTGFHTKGSSQARCKDKGLDSSEEEQQEYTDGLYFRPSTEHHLLGIENDFSGAGDAGHVRCHSSILRDLAMLGYLSKLQQFDPEQIFSLNSLIPYEVPFNAVVLRVTHSDVAPSHIMYSVNASWIGLCRILDDIRSQDDGPVILTQTPVCDCLGFGIVRGINMEKKVYHILTPVSPESLRLVNCLLVGNISIPHTIFKNQPGIEGEIPYVTSEYDFTISGSGKMKRNKQLRRREHV